MYIVSNEMENQIRGSNKVSHSIDWELAIVEIDWILISVPSPPGWTGAAVRYICTPTM